MDSRVYADSVTQLTVSKVAEQAGTSTDTLRYYERIGLLPAPQQSASGYRLYDGEALERLLFIKRSQSFGLSLDEIRELLEITERGCVHAGTRESFWSGGSASWTRR